jgi:hypothetical protein
MRRELDRCAATFIRSGRRLGSKQIPLPGSADIPGDRTTSGIGPGVAQAAQHRSPERFLPNCGSRFTRERSLVRNQPRPCCRST